MHNQAPDTYYIQVSQLKVGLYIHLDLGWMDHPFSVSNFKISDETQIEAIKALGLQKLRYDPNRSSANPTSLNNVIAFPRQRHQVLSDAQAALSPLQKKQQALRQAIHESEQKFLASSLAVKQLQRLASDHPAQAYLQATQLVADMVSSTLTESDLAIHAMNGSRTGDQHYQHELNVLVLSMMLAKTVNLSEEEANMLGLAAILHDIGKRRINDRILLKKEALTLSESHVLQTHVELGLDTLKSLDLPKRTLRLIAQHHELADGSGYPRGLQGDAIDPLAHILIIVNRYDNLCNPLNSVMAKSPYEALGMMFAQQRDL
ncbi:MAG TPA: HD domain-containing phosphohydrolase, partial [Methylophilus sp.]